MKNDRRLRVGPEDEDKIVYVVTALPGGCDGMDQSNRGGPVWAFGTRQEAENKVGRDTRYKIVPRVVKGRELLASIKKKLTVVERYYLRTFGIKF